MREEAMMVDVRRTPADVIAEGARRMQALRDGMAAASAETRADEQGGTPGQPAQPGNAPGDTSA